MSIRNALFNTVAVALGALAMASLLGTDAYSQAAGAEARGLKALTMQIELSRDDGPARDANRLVLAPREGQA
jgi:phytoene/squalene synthetase